MPFVVSGRLRDGRVEISVRDQGPGARRARGITARLSLIETLMDSVDVVPSDEGTTGAHDAQAGRQRRTGVNDGLVGLAIENQGDVIIARLTGELDIAGAPSTGEQIGQAVPNSALGLVVDMSELEFIDSSGVAMCLVGPPSVEPPPGAARGGAAGTAGRACAGDRGVRPSGADQQGPRRGSGRDLLSGERHLGWDGVHNARDLGGLSIAGGGETRWGAVIRADSLGKLTPAGWAAPGLRRPHGHRSAQRRRGRAWARRDPGHGTIHLPHDAIALWDGYEEWQAGTPYYAGHLECFPERSARVIAAVAEAPPGGVAVHCVDGRDRTGLIAVLLLALVGVERQEILTDTPLSEQRMEGLGPSRDTRLRRGDGGFLAERGTSAAELLSGLLAGVDLEARLHAGGLADAHLAALRERLIRP